jgi:hypothetical protein
VRRTFRRALFIMSAQPEFGTPVVNVHKRTTKVNFSIVIAVAVFFLIGIGAIVWFWQRS